MIGRMVGRATVTRSIAGGIFACAAERVHRAYYHYHVREWRTVFGLKVFPGRVVGDYVECFSCNNTYDPRVVGSTHPALWIEETA